MFICDFFLSIGSIAYSVALSLSHPAYTMNKEERKKERKKKRKKERKKGE